MAATFNVALKVIEDFTGTRTYGPPSPFFTRYGDGLGPSTHFTVEYILQHFGPFHVVDDDLLFLWNFTKSDPITYNRVT
jgi:hypothetical protein